MFMRFTDNTFEGCNQNGRGSDNWKRLEIFIYEITEGGLRVMYEVKVHTLAQIK